MKTDIWFVVLAYYSKTEDMLRIRRAVKGHNLIVVDNTLDTNRRFRNPMDSDAKHTYVDTTGMNLGYAGGMNRGIERALSSGAQWVILLNDDMGISEVAVKGLTSILSQAKPSVVGPFAGLLDKKRWTTILLKDQYKAYRDIDYLSGACVAIHRDVFESVGFLHEPYFMYYEDADFSVRARARGFNLRHIPILGIQHKSTKNVKDMARMHYYLARNHMLFVERNAPSGVKLHEFLRMPKTLTEHLQRKESTAVKGIADFATRKFGIGEIDL